MQNEFAIKDQGVRQIRAKRVLSKAQDVISTAVSSLPRYRPVSPKMSANFLTSRALSKEHRSESITQVGISYLQNTAKLCLSDLTEVRTMISSAQKNLKQYQRKVSSLKNRLDLLTSGRRSKEVLTVDQIQTYAQRILSRTNSRRSPGSTNIFSCDNSRQVSRQISSYKSAYQTPYKSADNSVMLNTEDNTIFVTGRQSNNNNIEDGKPKGRRLLPKKPNPKKLKKSNNNNNKQAKPLKTPSAVQEYKRKIKKIVKK